KLEKPKGVLGKDTRQSMINGAVYGFSSMCDGIIARYGRKKVIATGGMSRLIAPYCKSIDKIDPELTLKGLRLIGSVK
ncbi:MAG: pantothenate kinase, partial [Candidatus Omnitrophica bacterium]|nr:pantothenate kinase [Candidatus Omnitrophota bacterium]